MKQTRTTLSYSQAAAIIGMRRQALSYRMHNDFYNGAEPTPLEVVQHEITRLELEAAAIKRRLAGFVEVSHELAQ
jgi:hypothetical protein